MAGTTKNAVKNRHTMVRSALSIKLVYDNLSIYIPPELKYNGKAEKTEYIIY
jgi:hypothetical protein